MNCGVVGRHGWDLGLPWLWCRLAAVALIGPLAWEPPYATGAALQSKINKQINKCYQSSSQTVKKITFSPSVQASVTAWEARLGFRVFGPRKALCLTEEVWGTWAPAPGPTFFLSGHSVHLMRGLPMHVRTLGLHIQALPLAFAKSCCLTTKWAPSKATPFSPGKRNPGESSGSWLMATWVGNSTVPGTPSWSRRWYGLSPWPLGFSALRGGAPPEQGLRPPEAQGRAPQSGSNETVVATSFLWDSQHIN